jgi:hypothetical protein
MYVLAALENITMALSMDPEPRLSATMASRYSLVTSERPETTNVMKHANHHGASSSLKDRITAGMA